MGIRAGARGDAGMVPLSLRVPAKCGTQMPQTRCAQTVRHLCSNAVTRELRGTRSPDQGAPARILTAVGQAQEGVRMSGVCGRTVCCGLAE